MKQDIELFVEEILANKGVPQNGKWNEFSDALTEILDEYRDYLIKDERFIRELSERLNKYNS